MKTAIGVLGGQVCLNVIDEYLAQTFLEMFTDTTWFKANTYEIST